MEAFSKFTVILPFVWPSVVMMCHLRKNEKKVLKMSLFRLPKARFKCWTMCILCTPRPIYRSTYRSSVGRHIDRCSTDMSVDMSTDTRPIYRSRYIGRDVSVDILTDISTEISADISADSRPICRSICRPRVVVRQSADMSIDSLPTFRRYLTATCVLVTVV